MKCTLCNTPLRNKVDKFYYVCSTCGAYVKDKKYYINASQEKCRYEEHNNDISNSDYQKFTAPITDIILEKFNSTHIGLDYGCGTGPVISEVLKNRGYNIKLYDPYFYPDGDYLNYSYDYIFSCEVFEHFCHPKQEIETLLSLLKPNGYLIIKTHLYDKKIDFSTWYYRNDRTHVFIYTQKTIHFIAKSFNLDLKVLDERVIVLKKTACNSEQPATFR